MDVTVLRRFLKVGRFLGLIPWDFEGNTKSIGMWYTYTTAGICLFAVIMSYLNFATYYYNSDLDLDVDLCDVTLNNLEAITWVLSGVVCTWSALRHRSLWNDLFKNFAKIDEMLERNNCLIVNRAVHYISLIWFHIYFLLGVYFAYRITIDSFSLLMFFSARVYLYQKIFFLSTFTHLLLMLNNRYTCADRLLRKTHEGERHFDDIKTILYQLVECIKGINAIIGHSLLMIIINSFVAVLGVFKYVIYTAANPDDKSLTAYIWERTTFFICTITIIRRCELVRRSYERLLLACNELHAFTLDTSIRRELIQLLEYAENLAPTFTAAGYFKLNVSFISSYVSSLISYLIIVLQFKTQALKELGAFGAGMVNGTEEALTTIEAIGDIGDMYGKLGDNREN